MKKLLRLALLAAFSTLVLYPGAYIILVDTREPSVSEDGDPVYRSSYPLLSAPSVRWKGPLDLYFQKADAASRVFLPMDRIWRQLRGLPPSEIGDGGKFWLEYFDNKAEYGRLRSRNGAPGSERL